MSDLHKKLLSSQKEATQPRKPVESLSQEIGSPVAEKQPPLTIQLGRLDLRIMRQGAVTVLQRSIGNQAVLRLLGRKNAETIQRANEPAVVTAAKGAGLHKSNRKKKTPTQPVKVRSGGWFGTGIKKKIPKNAMITVDPAKPVTKAKYIWATHGGKEGYVKKKHIEGRVQIGTSTFYTEPVNATTFRIYDSGSNTYMTGPEHNMMKPGIRGVLGHLVQAEATTGLTIVEKEEIVKQLLKQAKLPGGGLPDPDLWGDATANIQNKIITRVNADRTTHLIPYGLITANHQLKSIEFTGADFHKHGQVPVFLTFETNNALNPDPRKIVYKPGNLEVDARLFGKTTSMAHSLDPGGTKISQYTILAREDASHEKYGWMEFVESGAPTTAVELMGVYESLAANMALSYLVGLEDVHQENVLLLTDRVQVIDMEATTGRFTKKQTSTGTLDTGEGGFKSQLWYKALDEGIEPKLRKQAKEGGLAAAPVTGTVLGNMRTAFVNVLNTAKGHGFNVAWQGHTQALRGMQSRIVPIATDNLYALRTPAMNKNWTQWQAAVNTAVPSSTEGAKLAKHPIYIARGQSGANDDFLRRILLSRGTYNALHRGEIPYYTRELNRSDRILDEEGNPITVNVGDISKIGGAIDTEMTARRTELQASTQANLSDRDAVKLFNAQILTGKIQPLNETIRSDIANRS